MQIVGDLALIQSAMGAAHLTMAAPCTLLVWMLLPCLYEIDLLVLQIIFF